MISPERKKYQHPQQHMPRIFFFVSWKVSPLPIMLVLIAVVVAFRLWTMPNLTTFLHYAPQFAQLWQLPANRRPLLILLLRVLSPLPVGAVVAVCCWGYSLLQRLHTSGPAQEDSTVSSFPLASPPEHRQVGHQAAESRSRARSHQSDGSSTMTTNPHVATQTDTSRRSDMQHRMEVVPTAQVAIDRPITSRQSTLPQASVALAEPMLAPEEAVSGPPHPTTTPSIEIRLLKDVRIAVCVTVGEGATRREIRREVRFTPHAKRIQLLAYLAWQRGTRIHRERLLEEIFGHGLSDEEATPRKLSDAFDSHRKLLRRDVREAVAALNQEAGMVLIPPHLDLFASSQKLWWLSAACCVVDLEQVEVYHQQIETARKTGKLANGVPEDVRAACDALIACYPGDFLDTLLKDYAPDFEPWVTSWARRPFTLYRDYYLQALWYRAEYELQAGQRLEDEAAEGSMEEEVRRERQREHYGRAAQRYEEYATYATSSRFDSKLTFARRVGGEHGERVVMSERAMRRCLMLYGRIGSTHQADLAYNAYYKHLRRLSSENWQPALETLRDLEAAKSRTSAYRLPPQPVLSSEIEPV